MTLEARRRRHDLASGQPPQAGNVPIKDIRIPAIRVRIRVLPDSLVRPTTRNRPRRA